VSVNLDIKLLVTIFCVLLKNGTGKTIGGLEKGGEGAQWNIEQMHRVISCYKINFLLRLHSAILSCRQPDWDHPDPFSTVAARQLDRQPYVLVLALNQLIPFERLLCQCLNDA